MVAFAVTLTAASPGRAQPVPDLRPGGQHEDDAKRITARTDALIAKALSDLTPAAADRSGPAIVRHRYLVFISGTMPGAAMREALQLASDERDVALVVRGLPPGGSLKAYARAVAALARRYDPVPAILIDPEAFRRHAISSVPTILDTATGRKAPGSLDPGQLERRTATSGEPVGPTWPIAEPDVAEVLQTRAASLDLDARARSSVERYWQRASILELPPAARGTARLVDVSVTTVNDLIDHQGQIVAAAGTRLNPLDHLPFTAKLVVLDARSMAQRRWARRQHEADRTTVFLVAGFDRASGWGGWKALGDELGAPAYLLTPAVAARLGIEATPSMITGRGRDLLLVEIAEDALGETQGE